MARFWISKMYNLCKWLPISANGFWGSGWNFDEQFCMAGNDFNYQIHLGTRKERLRGPVLAFCGRNLMCPITAVISGTWEERTPTRTGVEPFSHTPVQV
jgi:hypothetical protein